LRNEEMCNVYYEKNIVFLTLDACKSIVGDSYTFKIS